MAGSQVLLARSRCSKIGPAAFFWRPGSILGASRCVSETALSAQNRPRSILHRFFMDFASIFVNFRKIFRRISLEPPVTKAQNRNLKKESRDPHRASWLLRGAVASYCSHAFRNDFRTLHVQPFFIAYPQAHLVYYVRQTCYARRCSGSVRGPFGIRSGSVWANFGPKFSEPNKLRFQKIFNLCGRRRCGGPPGGGARDHG